MRGAGVCAEAKAMGAAVGRDGDRREARGAAPLGDPPLGATLGAVFVALLVALSERREWAVAVCHHTRTAAAAAAAARVLALPLWVRCRARCFLERDLR